MARTRRLTVSSLLEDSHTPFLVLDSQARVRQSGAGLTGLLGWSESELEGLVCDRRSPAPGSSLELLGNAIAPLPELAAGQMTRTEIVVPHRNGSAVRCELTAISVIDSSSDVTGYLLFFSPGSSSNDGQRGGGPSRTFYAEINALRLDMRKRFRTEQLIGSSPPVRKALQQSEIAARSRCSFLIHGPEGSGRQFLARLIHQRSEMAEAPFMAVDCRLLTNEQLIILFRQITAESAGQQKSEKSQNQSPPQPASLRGLLVLLDAHLLSTEVQRWLISNVFSKATIWVGATSLGPLSRGPLSQFLSEDISSRLTSIEIEVPPLHHRGDDVLLIAQKLLEDAKRDLGTKAEILSDQTKAEFLKYRWPGNVRELCTVMQAACRQCQTKVIEVADLPLGFRVGRDAQKYPVLPELPSVSIDVILQDFERDVITSTLEQCDGNKAEAARRLGLTRPKFYRRMAALGLDPDE